MSDGMKWEGGQPTRPLSVREVREAIEEMLAQWIDAHPDHDSGNGDAQDTLCEIGDELEERLPVLLSDAKSR